MSGQGEDRIKLLAKYLQDRFILGHGGDVLGVDPEMDDECFETIIRECLITLQLNMLIDIKVVDDIAVIKIVGKLPMAKVWLDDLSKMIAATRPNDHPGVLEILEGDPDATPLGHNEAK